LNIILNKIEESYRKNLPFVVYNKPNSKRVMALFQKDEVLHTLTSNFDDQGFVFAPFNSINPTVFFPLTHSEFIKANLKLEEINNQNSKNCNESSKSFHIKLVEKALLSIKQNEFKKVVISREEIVEINEFDISLIYSKLLQLYPNAFVYVWFHPKIGLWFGATPETLLKVENNKFATMSLAGTLAYNDGKQPNWSSKEIEEQELVTEYIVHKLSSFSKNLHISETQTVKAGSLLHLRTEIKGELDLQKNNGLFSLIDLLHPTPAVCGLPKEAAKEFILENENYNRSYYTGFLGELNMSENEKKDSHLFVNLRCMEIKEKKAHIYIGGGITKESNPEKEWEETLAKSNIMLNVL
jgi:isochorismate synthase